MTRLIAALLLAAAAPAAAQTVAITNGRVATMAGAEPIEGATLVMQDGRIAAVGRNVPVPAGAQVLDAGGAWVTPGLFAGFSRLSLIDVDAVEESDDTDADRAVFTASIDVTPGINPNNANVAINRIEGLTRAAVVPAPGRDVFIGRGAIIDLGDDMDAVTRPTAFQYVELGERGAALAGGSRGAAFAAFRNGLREAQDYAKSPQAFEGGKDRDAILTRLDAAALVPVVQGREPALIHVERASDIRAVLDLKREFPRLRPVLVGAAEGWMVAREIAAAGVPVIVFATVNLPSRFETIAATQSNAGRLVDAGVTVALGMIDDDEARQVRLLPQHAGNLVALTQVPGATGLTHSEALASITRAPAEIYGLSRELGTLEPGKRADVVVWSGDPLELASAPTAVFIDGQVQPLVSRQTRLRDRYLGLRRDGLPLHYPNPAAAPANRASAP